jgi:hypothetical protein
MDERALAVQARKHQEVTVTVTGGSRQWQGVEALGRDVDGPCPQAELSRGSRQIRQTELGGRFTAAVNYLGGVGTDAVKTRDQGQRFRAERARAVIIHDRLHPWNVAGNPFRRSNSSVMVFHSAGKAYRVGGRAAARPGP